MSREKQIFGVESITGLPCWQGAKQCYCEIECEDCIESHLLAAGWRKQEWISVEERLPKNYRPVLVACEGLTIGGYAPIAIGSYGGGLWSLADADGTAYLTKYMRCTVTHWMPLPEPPKGE